MDYTIRRERDGGTAKRRGTLRVVASGTDDSSGGEIAYTDDYTDANDDSVDITLTASIITPGIITVAYTATNTGYDATIYYSLNYLD
jgi:hypothetical protein